MKLLKHESVKYRKLSRKIHEDLKNYKDKMKQADS